MAPVHIEIVTLFPELFESPLRLGLLGKAVEDARVQIGFVDPRTFATDRHRSVDDAPYGGGAGMVMKVDVLAPAIAEARARAPGARAVLLCPQGQPFKQATARRLSEQPGLVLICGRYEGFDERVRGLVDEEISIGDFVLTGGEYAALSVIDAVVRLRPGTLGNADSAASDSFEAGALEHPQYTRPPEFMGRVVPDVLLSGDHEKITKWRHQEALRRTKLRRPELLAEIELAPEDELVLGSVARSLGDLALAISVNTAVEVRALLELAEVYALSAVHFISSDAALVADELRRFEGARVAPEPRRRGNAAEKLKQALLAQRTEKRRALVKACSVSSSATELYLGRPKARWIGTFEGPGPALGPAALRAELRAAPVGAEHVLTLGLPRPPPPSPSIRGLSGRPGRLDPGNTGVAGLAVWLDRLLGEA